jgi:hypothetical protein
MIAPGKCRLGPSDVGRPVAFSQGGYDFREGLSTHEGGLTHFRGQRTPLGTRERLGDIAMAGVAWSRTRTTHAVAGRVHIKRGLRARAEPGALGGACHGCKVRFTLPIAREGRA